jgi:hypothetical protein
LPACRYSIISDAKNEITAVVLAAALLSSLERLDWQRIGVQRRPVQNMRDELGSTRAIGKLRFDVLREATEAARQRDRAPASSEEFNG